MSNPSSRRAVLMKFWARVWSGRILRRLGAKSKTELESLKFETILDTSAHQFKIKILLTRCIFRISCIDDINRGNITDVCAMPDSDGGACQGKALKLVIFFPSRATRGHSRSLGVTHLEFLGHSRLRSLGQP